MTEQEAEQIEGMCTACGEYTTLATACCSAGVSFEGHVYHIEDIEDDDEEVQIDTRRS